MNQRSFTPHVIEAVSRALRVTGHFSTEKDLQLAVYNEFRSNGLCERECRVEFSPASVPPPTPPLPFEPMDVCEERGCRKLDLLATLQSELVAIELKFSRVSRWRGSCRGIPLPIAARSDVVP